MATSSVGWPAACPGGVEPETGMKYQFCKATRLGNRVVNEDRIGIAETEHAVLLVLADGMGGYRGGQIAAKTLVNRMLRQFRRSKLPAAKPQAYLRDLVADAHLAVLRAGNKQYPPIEPRTTCVLCLIQNGSAWWAHVGDSRLYLFRGGQPLTRTIDHSKIEEMRRRGKLNPQEIEKHPQRHLVTRCVGFQKHPPIPTMSDEMLLEKYDVLLLCSDGLWGTIAEQQLADTLTTSPLAEAVERMAYQAEFRSYPEADNISIISLRWISDKSDTRTPLPDELTETLDVLHQALGENGRSL
jgi:serine/threonine protein phosphatase PrpC